MVTTIAFDAFACYRFRLGESSINTTVVESVAFLRKDVAVRCETDEHAAIIRQAWVAVALYPVGLLLLNFILLLCARRAILLEQPTAFSRAMRFIYKDYKPHFYWCGPVVPCAS